MRLLSLTINSMTNETMIWDKNELPDKIETFDDYKSLYKLSIENPNLFWKMAAQRLYWYQFPTIIKNTEFDYRTERGIDIKWYEDGLINVCYNCLDRHIENNPHTAERIAYFFESDTPSENRYKITYGKLLDYVQKFANVLKKHDVKKGDRVTIYMSMSIEICVVLLACARIGAIHSVIFAGFSPNSIAERISDCNSTIVITTDISIRGGKYVLLKDKIDQALKMEQCKTVKTVLVFQRQHIINEINNNYLKELNSFEWIDQRDFWVHEELDYVDNICPPEQMNAEDPLFILYTSGSTGKPKGVLHTTGGYLTYVSLAFKYVFDYNEDDIYMCTADIGWITGHSFVVYGPLSNRSTTVLFEGIPTYPDVSRYWNIVDKYQISIFYTAPTAIRSLMAYDDSFVTRTNRQSLRLLGTAGEPINPKAWQWYYEVIGNSKCPIIDTWWQTETSAPMITPIPNLWQLEPGSVTFPFFGIKTEIFNKTSGELLNKPNEGELCITDSWPGQARTLYNNHQRFIETYFKVYPGYYFSGDECQIKENGYHLINGRVDDVIIISGHNIGTAEVESALVAHDHVSEAAVVGYPDSKKNQGMYCFVILKKYIEESDQLRKDLIKQVRDMIGAHVYPDIIQFVPELPKTRSGKIMRRILRKIVEPDVNNLGDISTLNDPTIVEHLIKTSPRTIVS